MCGICGYTGRHGYSKENMETLLLANESRGHDATGIYSASRQLIQKHNIPAKTFVKLMPLPTEETTLIGHTRAMTQGKNIPKNAHPFRKGNIIGVHNGIIHNDYTLAAKYGFSATVDSEAIFEMISRKGFKGIEEIKGNLAIAWVDLTKPDSLFLFRSGNPCFTGLLDGSIYFSSLDEPLKTIACTDVGTIKSDTVFEFVGGKVVNSTELDIPLSYGNYGGYGMYGYDEDWRGGTKNSSNCSVGTCSSDTNKCKWVKDPSYAKGGYWTLNTESIVSEAKNTVPAVTKYTDYPMRGETLAQRKAKLDATYHGNGESRYDGHSDSFIISYPKQKLQVEIPASTIKSANVGAMQVVKPEKVMDDDTLDEEGKLAGGGHTDDLGEMIDVMRGCYTYVNRWGDKEAKDLAERLRKILY